MSYEVTRKYFMSRLMLKGFVEAGEMVFKTDTNMTNKFILRSRNMNSEDPRLGDRLEPNRTLEVHLALKLSDTKIQVVEYNGMVIRIEQLIKEIPNPTNFQASPFNMRNIKFVEVTEELNDTWIEFVLTFDIEEELLYA